MPWMMGQLAISQRDSLESLKICLQEIFNNIADHSTERIGCVFAQHYPAEKHVIIVASDFGIGIPNRIRQREGDLDDATVLKKAVTEGYSTKTFSYRDGIRVSAKNCHGYYPGTLFEIIMNTASFYDVSQEEDFSWSS